MAPDSLLTPLVRVPLFNGLARSQLQALADAAERIAIDKGQLIIADDQPGDAAFLIVKGRAARLDGIGRPMEPLPLGSLVGEMAMLIETRHTATIMAVEPVKVLKFPRAGVLEVMRTDPDIAAHFVGKLTARLHVLSNDLRAVEHELAPAKGERPAAAAPLAGPPLDRAPPRPRRNLLSAAVRSLAS